MRDKRKIVVLLSILCVMLLTGCGKKKIDVMENMTVKFDGYNGYGTVELENEYAWENEAFEIAGIESIDGLNTLGEALVIEGAVSYEITPNENLSNGDEITVKATIDEAVLENYKFELVAEQEKKFVVENLPELTSIDPFEYIEITYDGISPNGKAIISNKASEDCPVIYHYTVEPESGLKNGDVVNVTISDMNPEDKALENGYKLSQLEKEYTVSGLMHYADSLSEIPDDAMNQLKQQTEDIIRADVAESNNYSVKNLEFLGNYFLDAKDDNIYSGYNYCYYVYKVDVEGKTNESYYYYSGYYDILILEDGTCSYDFNKCVRPNNFYGRLDYAIIYAHDNLDSLYNECVTKNLDKYTFESTVTEG